MAYSYSLSLHSSQDIEIGYYSNSKVELKDKVSGALKATHALADVAATGDEAAVASRS